MSCEWKWVQSEVIMLSKISQVHKKKSRFLSHAEFIPKNQTKTWAMCGLLGEKSLEGEQGTGKYNGGKYDRTSLGTCMKMW
jgi:hypothetical protein